MQQHLEVAGLTRNEAKVYITLLKSGSLLAGTIAEKTGVHRRNVYDALERLMRKGLVSVVTKNNRKWFQPSDPERLLHMMDEQKAVLAKYQQALGREIKKLKPHVQEKHDVRFFKGKEGIKTVFEDILATGEDYAGYGPGEQLERVLKFYMPGYIRRRLRKKIHPKLIYNESAHNRKYTCTPGVDCRFLPDEFSSHAALRIYGTKVAIILFSESEPLAIVIDNTAIADGYRKYFTVMWNAAAR